MVESEEMFTRAPFLSRLMASSVKVSESAGTLIKSILAGGDLGVVEKGSSSAPDPQTEADRAAQYLIVNSLLGHFKAITVIGEEEKTSVVPTLERGWSKEVVSAGLPSALEDMREEDVVVWVDPLDGTSELARATDKSLATLQQVTVLIGIAHRGRVVGGVIHQPWHGDNGEGRTVWAIQGLGVHGLSTAPAQAERVVVTTRSHSTPSVENALKELSDRGLSSRVERVGGAGFKVLKVLEGAAAYVFASGGCKKWDTAAPQAILEAAGGQLTDISGRPLDYSAEVQKNNSGGVLATAPWVNHSEYLQGIPGDLKDSLPEFHPRK